MAILAAILSATVLWALAFLGSVALVFLSADRRRAKLTAHGIDLGG
jgi:hypothetical protein